MAVTLFKSPPPPLFRKPKNVEILKTLGVSAVVEESSNFFLTLQDFLNPDMCLMFQKNTSNKKISQIFALLIIAAGLYFQTMSDGDAKLNHCYNKWYIQESIFLLVLIYIRENSDFPIKLNIQCGFSHDLGAKKEILTHLAYRVNCKKITVIYQTIIHSFEKSLSKTYLS